MAEFPQIEAFDFQPTTRLVFGAGSIAQLGTLAAEVLAAEGVQPADGRVLVVSDPGIVNAGHTQRGLDTLHAAGLEAVLFDGVQENPTTSHVDAGVEFAREYKTNLIVGLGGGSSMDCAKGINFVLSNGGTMADYWGVGKATRPMLPLIAVPTTAGTGSEAQSFALIADERTHQKMACGDKKAAARVAILDPELTLTQPTHVTVAAGLDAVAHAVESYVCTRAKSLSRLFAGRAWELTHRSLERVLHAPDDLGARADMLLGAHYAGISIENSMLGAAHACANPLTALCGLTHGVAVSLMLPAVIRFNAPVAGYHYGEMMQTRPTPHALSHRHDSSGLEDAAKDVANEIERLVDAAKLKRGLGAHGVPRARIPELAVTAARQWTARFNPRPLTTSDFERLYEAAWQ